MLIDYAHAAALQDRYYAATSTVEHGDALADAARDQARRMARIAATGIQVTADDMRQYGRDLHARGCTRPAHVHAAEGWDDAQWLVEADAAEAAGYDDGVAA